MKILTILLFWFVLFNVSAQVPFIDSMSIYVGQPGDPLTIYGTNFHATPDSNIVHFGPVKAMVLSGTTTTLNVTVPPGADFGRVTVVCNGRTAWSPQDFLPTFNGGPMIAPSFGGTIELATGSSWVRDPRAADIDGDGKIDVLACGTANASGSAIRVWHNVGNPAEVTVNNWQSGVDFSLIATPRSMGVGDMDGDGKPDVVVVMNNGTVLAIFKNTSTPGIIDAATFAAPVYYTCSGSPQDLELADFDGDGKLDVVLGNHYFDGVVTVYRNTSTTGVIDATSLAPQVHFYAGQYNYNVTVNDFNDDGKIDIATSSWGSDSVFVFINSATTGVIDASSFLPAVGFESLTLPASVYSGDFNGDGRDDMVVSHTNDDLIRVYENTSTTNVIDGNSFSSYFDLPTGNGSVELMVTDMTGDGKPEILVANKQGTASVGLYQNIHNSGPLSPASFTSDVEFAIAANCQGLFAQDLNGDSRPEIIITSANDDIVGILRNDIFGNTISTGMFGGKISWWAQAINPWDVGIGDFDDDGKPDVFTSNNAGFDATIWPNNSTPGNISYAAQEAGKFTLDWGGIISNNQVIDLDSDGKLDVVFNNYNAARWSVSHNIHVQGNPLDATSFDTSPWFWSIGDPSGPDHADLNKDGRADFVHGDYNYSFLRFSENISVPGTLDFDQYFQITPFCCFPTSKIVTPDDLDNDGDMDLIISAPSIDRLYFMENKGFTTLNTNSFFPAVYMTTGDIPTKTFTMDLNQDGWRDLVVLLAGEGLYIYLHNGTGGTIDGSMWNSTPIHLPYSGGFIAERSVNITDVNGDGKADFAFSSTATNEVVFWVNNSSGPTISANDFQEHRFGVGSISNSMNISDFDLDGKPDIYFTDVNETFSMLRNEQGETNPLPIISTFQSTDLCPGDSVTLYAPQSDAYLWSNGDTTSFITVHTANSYGVIVTNAGVNDTLSAVTVTEALPIDVSIASSGTLCVGDTLNANVVGSASTLYWSSGEGTNNIVPAQAGLYSVSVTNAAGCTDMDTITIQFSTVPVIDLWEDSLTCFGECVTLNASLNTQLQTAQWSPSDGLSDANIANPIVCLDSAITYYAEFVDVNGCVAKDTVDFSVLALPELLSNDTILCAGGSVQLMATWGGTYSWAPASNLTNATTAFPTATVQQPTMFTLNMTSAQGCSITDFVLVDVHSLVDIDLWEDTLICPEACVQIDPTVTGNYTSVNWSPTLGLNDPSIVNPIACTDVSTTYYAEFADSLGCLTKDTVDFIVTQLPELFSNDTVICMGTSLQLSATAGGSYSWSPATGLNNTNTASPTATIQNATMYTLNMTDAQGCNITDSVFIDVHPPITVNIWSDTSVCEGECIVFNPSVSFGWVNAIWSPGTGLNDSTILNPTACVTSNEQYDLTIEDANGCFVQTSLTTTAIPLSNVPQITFDGITLTSTSGVTYQWYLDGQPIPGATNMVYTPTQNGTYTVEVTEAGACPTVSDPLFIDDLSVATQSPSQWTLAPNPTNGTVVIHGDLALIEAASVRDIKGRLIQELTAPFDTIDLSNVESGTYYIQITTAESSSVEKIVVQH